MATRELRSVVRLTLARLASRVYSCRLTHDHMVDVGMG